MEPHEISAFMHATENRRRTSEELMRADRVDAILRSYGIEPDVARRRSASVERSLEQRDAQDERIRNGRFGQTLLSHDPEREAHERVARDGVVMSGAIVRRNFGSVLRVY